MILWHHQMHPRLPKTSPQSHAFWAIFEQNRCKIDICRKLWFSLFRSQNPSEVITVTSYGVFGSWLRKYSNQCNLLKYTIGSHSNDSAGDLGSKKWKSRFSGYADFASILLKFKEMFFKVFGSRMCIWWCQSIENFKNRWKHV